MRTDPQGRVYVTTDDDAPLRINIDTPVPVNPLAAWTPQGYQQIETLTSAQNLTVPASATFAVFVAEGQVVRWRDDGTAPTTSVGMPLATHTPMTYIGNLAAFRVIETAASAKLNVSYYR